MNTKRSRASFIAAVIALSMIMSGCGSSASSEAEAEAVVSAAQTSEAEQQESEAPEDSKADKADADSEKSDDSKTDDSGSADKQKDTDSAADTEAQPSQQKKGNNGGAQEAETTPATDGGRITPTGSTGTAEQIDTADLFSNRDLKQEADTSDAQKLTVADGKTISITEAGVYVISGTAENCTVRVETEGDNDKVQLVLDGVTITNTDSPAIYVVSADKCFVTTAAGSENTLSVTGAFTAADDTNTDAVIFSKDDLVLNGSGTLKISSTDNGISGHDDLKITGGTYDITASSDAIEANDSIAVCGGSFTINAGKDGLHCENDDDYTLGWIYISDGTFNITSKSDGIQGTTYTCIDGGTFNISSAEGIEGTYVIINDGSITISASDDGVNASKKSTAFTAPSFEMNGGSLTITMGSGDTDAIDVNGNVTVSGGTINITCPTQGTAESFDYDGTATFTGGTIIINGTQVDSIPQPMMMGGGMGGRGGMGGGQDFGGQDGQFPERPDGVQDFGGRGGMGGRGRQL